MQSILHWISNIGRANSQLSSNGPAATSDINSTNLQVALVRWNKTDPNTRINTGVLLRQQPPSFMYCSVLKIPQTAWCNADARTPRTRESEAPLIEGSRHTRRRFLLSFRSWGHRWCRRSVTGGVNRGQWRHGAGGGFGVACGKEERKDERLNNLKPPSTSKDLRSVGVQCFYYFLLYYCSISNVLWSQQLAVTWNLCLAGRI